MFARYICLYACDCGDIRLWCSRWHADECGQALGQKSGNSRRDPKATKVGQDCGIAGAPGRNLESLSLLTFFVILPHTWALERLSYLDFMESYAPYIGTCLRPLWSRWLIWLRYGMDLWLAENDQLLRSGLNIFSNQLEPSKGVIIMGYGIRTGWSHRWFAKGRNMITMRRPFDSIIPKLSNIYIYSL